MLAVFVFIALEILRNWYLIRVRRISPDKRRAATMRFFVALLICVFLSNGDWQKAIEALVMVAFCFWFFFDYGLNIVDGQPLTYLNETGPIDRFQRNTFGLQPWFFFKLVLAAASIAFYLKPWDCLWQYREGC